MDYIEQKNFSLIICPDSSSNDYEQHAELRSKGIKTLVLDHHEADAISSAACIINNQLPLRGTYQLLLLQPLF